MPDASRSVRRPPARTTLFAQALSPKGGAARAVVGGLLRGQPELALLQKAAAGIATIELVDDRFALFSTVMTTRPGALVLPPYDSDRTSTAPLVLRMRREVPSVPVLVISSHPGGAGQPMLRAVQAGAHVIAAPTAAELQAALASLLEPKDLSQ
jgi:hypothetical protein